MKPSFHYPTQQKDSQALIRKILDQNTLFNILDPTMITEILLAFKVNESNLLDRTMKITAIKQKLLDMIIDERDQCVSYLILPKFNNVNENTKGILKQIINSTWNNFLKREVQEEKNRRCARYFCRTDNIKQAQQFHLGLFALFRSAYFYQNPNFYRMMGGYSQMMPPPNTQTYHQGYTMPIPNLPPDPYFSMQAPMPVSQNHSVNVKIQQDKNGVSDVFNLSKDEGKKVKKKNTENSKHKPQKQLLSLGPICEAFIGCLCKGKVPESQKYFSCEECNKKLHLKCLNIPTYATQKVGVKKICPECSLKNTNALYAEVGEPVETFWSDDRELQKQKIVIKGKRCKQVQQKKYSIQLKFMKIEGRSMYEWQNPGANKLMPLNDAPYEKPKPFLNSVLIKDDVLTKGNGDDVKISLDCMKNPDNKEDRKPTLLFVTVNVVRPKTLQEILSQSYQYFDQNYLDKFMKDRDELKIQIFDIKFKIFNKPVRGSDCEHPDLYDLQQFANHCIDLHTDQCFCCSKRCRTFKIDRKVQQQIKKIKATFSDQSKYPQAIYYQKDGTFKYSSQYQSKQYGGPAQNAAGMQNYDSNMQNQNEGDKFQFEPDLMSNQEQLSSVSMDQMESEQDEDEQFQNKGSRSQKTDKFKKQK